MTDPRPICPIPPDAKVGDIVVLRDGRRKKITSTSHEREVTVESINPGWIQRDGSSGGYGIADYECVGFEYADGSKPNLPRSGKPKRTQAQRDIEWLRKFVENQDKHNFTMLSDRKRIRKIADRMEGKT